VHQYRVNLKWIKLEKLLQSIHSGNIMTRPFGISPLYFKNGQFVVVSLLLKLITVIHKWLF